MASCGSLFTHCVCVCVCVCVYTALAPMASVQERIASLECQLTQQTVEVRGSDRFDLKWETRSFGQHA